MLLLLLLLAPCSATITIDPTHMAQVYDGHGALSAGASSRLLYDYEEPHRSDILDLLFLPNSGANMHMIKVEIGGDGQSTDGTEPSHMHYEDDLSCNRGYEFWLLEEARKRNPDIKTYALSWASPYWVGDQGPGGMDSYYTPQEIDYHIKWLECVKNNHSSIGNIDYIGNWNERPWGNANWTKQFKDAMDKAGFTNTQIIIPDGGGIGSIESAMDSDNVFHKDIGGIGVHYPCNHPAPELESKYNIPYWSSEDYSTVGNWDGAACWGRLLNQNYIRMNQTSTISWSLIWSVYQEGFSYFGNGLMYGMTPWSGYFEAGMPGSSNGGAIWTNAHTCQFVEPGWRYLPVHSNGSGYLQQGGSYVTLVDPTGTHFTMVLEKLEGRCLRCAGQVTETEAITFTLASSFNSAKLIMFLTNETHHFIEMTSPVITNSQFTVTIPKDSIITVSSWLNGQKKVFPDIPANKPFPVPYSDNFDSYPVDALARYFADNGGSFQVAMSPISSERESGNMVLKQWVKQENGVTRWGRNVDPVTLIGQDLNTAITVSVNVIVGAGAPPTPSPPAPKTYNLQNQFNKMCLDVKGEKTVDGTVVDVYTCVSQNNEEFVYNNNSGYIIEVGSGKCVTTDEEFCGKSATLCIATCKPDMSWNMLPDNTIRPRSQPGSCLQSAGKPLDSPVFVASCSSPATAQQSWINKTTGGGESTIPHAGICTGSDKSGYNGLCLLVYIENNNWELSLKGDVLAQGPIDGSVSEMWTSLKLMVSASEASVVVNGKSQTPVPLKSLPAGMVALRSGYNVAYFDDFSIA
eukprot:m.109132 g.109132  ORF g.109132 m.109132 type:complete len:800 (-) comp13993_c0_seq1:24-2423(-)